MLLEGTSKLQQLSSGSYSPTLLLSLLRLLGLLLGWLPSLLPIVTVLLGGLPLLTYTVCRLSPLITASIITTIPLLLSGVL